MKRLSFSKPPALPFNYIPRPNLQEALNQAAHCSLTFVHAPSGYGKSLGVAHWLQSQDSLNVRWSDFSAENQHTNTAIETVIADLFQLTGNTCPRYWVLDHFPEHLDVRVQNDLCATFRRHPNLHLFILSQQLPLSLYVQAVNHRQQCNVISTETLRFQSAEVMAIYALHHHHLSPGETQQILSITQGWPVGIQQMVKTHGQNATPVPRPQSDLTRDPLTLSVASYLKQGNFSQLRSDLLTYIPQYQQVHKNALLYHLLSRLPDPILMQDPQLAVYYGIVLISQGERDAAQQWTERFKKHYSKHPEKTGFVLILQCWAELHTPQHAWAHLTDMLQKARQSLNNPLAFADIIPKMESWALLRQRKYSEVIHHLTRNYCTQDGQFTFDPAQTFVWRHLYTAYFNLGEFHCAEQVLTYALHKNQHGGAPPSSQVLILGYLANLAMIHNQVPTFKFYQKEILKQPHCSGFYLEAVFLLFYIVLGYKDFAQAQDYLSHLYETFAILPSIPTSWQAAMQEMERDLRLCQGELSAIQDWLRDNQLTDAAFFKSSIGLMGIYRFSYYCFFKKDYNTALSFLNLQCEEMHKDQLWGILTDIYALRAFTHYALGQLPEAIEDLSQALKHSETQANLSWILYGLCDFRPLLEHIHLNSDLNSAFLEKVKLNLKAVQHDYTFRVAPPLSFMLQQLTEQESTIFRLLLSHQRNQDIAHHLCISMNTLKTHIRHIYKKLGVKSRKQLKALLGNSLFHNAFTTSS